MMAARNNAKPPLTVEERRVAMDMLATGQGRRKGFGYRTIAHKISEISGAYATVDLKKRREREDVPDGCTASAHDARFVRYAAQGDLADWDEFEVRPDGVGLVVDAMRGGVILVAPRVLEPGQTMDEGDGDSMFYDLQEREWLEGWQVREPDGRVPGWTRPRIVEVVDE